jgi:hypothetical protein
VADHVPWIVVDRPVSFRQFFNPRAHARAASIQAGLTDGFIVIDPMLPGQHPINSAKSLFVRPCFVVRPVVSINARFGYTPLMLVCRRLCGSQFGEALFPRKLHPGLNWRTASGPIICSGN